MKIKVAMHDNSSLYYAIGYSVINEVKALNLPIAEHDALIESRRRQEHDKLSKWFECDTTLAIEFDTDKMTATVLEAK